MSNPVNSILGRDLHRMASEGYVSDPRIDPRVQREANWTFKHGMSRVQLGEQIRAENRQQFEAEAVSDLSGEPPEGVDTKGLGPKRALYVRYDEWRRQVGRELHELEQKKADLEALIAAPGEAERELCSGIKKTVNLLLGRGEGGGGADDAKALADRVAVAQHYAEAAKAAMEELDHEIDRARLRFKHLEAREIEFLHPALIELADVAGVGSEYLRAIENLRSAASLVFGLAEIVHTYGSGFGRPQGPIALPRIAMPSIGGLKEIDFTISQQGASDIWKHAAEALRRNPRQNFSGIKPIAAPPGGYSCWPWKE